MSSTDISWPPEIIGLIVKFMFSATLLTCLEIPYLKDMAQNELDIPVGTIKATVLIETILAAFQMDEILYALKEHSAGLNCGRWDYIFSFIKKFKNNSNFVLPV